MKFKILYSIVIMALMITACSSAGPRVTFGFYKGKWCRKVVTFNYPEGIKTKMDKYIYHKGALEKEIRYTERWPNGEYHFISKKGFVVFDENGYIFNNQQNTNIPDNIIYNYFDSLHIKQYKVYMNGIAIPYTLGEEDGKQSMQFLRNPPGVYSWKDGKEFFLREFTPEEWESHRRMNEQLNQTIVRPDSLKN